MCSDSPPPPPPVVQQAPDYSGQNSAAVQQAGISAEQLAWSKQIYSETAGDRAYAVEQSKKISDAQLKSMEVQTNLAQDYDLYNKTTYRPLEKGIVADAVGYDTTARREAMAGQAIADVGTQADASRETMAREAMARGVDPSSGNFAASQGAFAVREAAAKASAGNTARTQVETIGAARKMDAANLGRGLASNQATSAGIALTAGNSSGANAQQPLSAAAAGADILNRGASGAQQGLAGAAATYGGINSSMNSFNANANSFANANRPQKTDNSAMWGSLGTMGGAAIANAPALMTAFSDEKMKENISPVDPEEALAQVASTPVSSYNYKEGSPGAKDAGTDKTVGPMYLQVAKTMGDAATVKGEKKIDLIAMNGINMAAIQGLSRKVDKVIAAQGLAI